MGLHDLVDVADLLLEPDLLEPEPDLLEPELELLLKKRRRVWLISPRRRLLEEEDPDFELDPDLELDPELF